MQACVGHSTWAVEQSVDPEDEGLQEALGSSLEDGSQPGEQDSIRQMISSSSSSGMESSRASQYLRKLRYVRTSV